MKKLLWLGLAVAALPAQAQQGPEDPVVWPCYMCTPDERVQVALSKGVGEHLVYNASGLEYIYGYRVTEQGGELTAEQYTPASWIRSQHRDLMLWYRHDRGEFVRIYDNVSMHAPDSPHGRNDNRLWAHHVSALNPLGDRARELVRRSVTAGMNSFLTRDTEHGRLLRYAFQLDGDAPIIVRFNIIYSQLGYIEFYLDHETRTWNYLRAGDNYHRMQERPEDFLAADGGPRDFYYRRLYSELQPYFVQRAKWAGVELQGSLPGSSDVNFRCSKPGEKIECRIE